ncbi:hypothetical protein AB6D34_18255 [Pectobacterium brasiliense]|uniref:Uncharacterized protein n=1 Tax=Pectobacterium brasiliense TaxID=180957 RepID=A0A3S0ZMN0_9GAMM|nr:MULTISPECIES: hypothetical protein [Pectobacterium]GKW29482.1 hypothetical protein PEC331060_26600 [Pectobacterium carotovorum subsp. carotovorum]MBN3048112.1 hypothetical protein [Pectobacterium brasiliense]MBN3057087.1 hypothetical protein [Pectobacterium brasiliense]MBN3077601.1 hypothetical protein [Pectobacterium brasiliense]MBN3082044.1 hypothetical protein [Pectobacterium polaris]
MANLTNNTSTERLEKIASWREKYGDNESVVIPADEAASIVSELLSLRAQLSEKKEDSFRKRVYELLCMGSAVPDSSAFACIENACRRSDCLGKIERYMSVKVGVDENDDTAMYRELLNWGEEPAKYIETFKVALPKFIESLKTEYKGA